MLHVRICAGGRPQRVVPTATTFFFLEKWEGELEHDIKKLIEYSAYKLP